MKKMDYAAWISLPALALSSSIQAGSFEGYLVDSMGAIVHTPYGECIHTGYWDKSYAQPECDEVLEIRSKYAVAVEKAKEEGLPAPEKPAEIVALETAVVEEVEPTAVVEVGMPESADSAIQKLTEVEVGDLDSLWTIAANEQVYGNAELWPLLLCANREQIVDADLIYAGQVLNIPQESTAADVEAAIMHATMRGEWELGEVEDSDLEYLAVHCNR